jgi:hypothetical protein
VVELFSARALALQQLLAGEVELPSTVLHLPIGEVRAKQQHSTAEGLDEGSASVVDRFGALVGGHRVEPLLADAGDDNAYWKDEQAAEDERGRRRAGRGENG